MTSEQIEAGRIPQKCKQADNAHYFKDRDRRNDKLVNHLSEDDQCGERYQSTFEKSDLCLCPRRLINDVQTQSISRGIAKIVGRIRQQRT